jgi:hypothetical protein
MLEANTEQKTSVERTAITRAAFRFFIAEQLLILSEPDVCIGHSAKSVLPETDGHPAAACQLKSGLYSL